MGPWRSVLVVVSLLLGQAHACLGQIVCPDGEVCQVCTVAPNSPSAENEADLCGAKAGASDCQSCCTFEACPDEGESKLAATVGPETALDLWFEPVVEMSLPRPQPPSGRFESLAAPLFSPPPLRAQPRAPPAPIA